MKLSLSSNTVYIQTFTTKLLYWINTIICNLVHFSWNANGCTCLVVKELWWYNQLPEITLLKSGFAILALVNRVHLFKIKFQLITYTIAFIVINLICEYKNFDPKRCFSLLLYSINIKTCTIFLSFWMDRSGQTVQTQIRLLLEKQSDQGLHCLQFPLHLLDSLLWGTTILFNF